MNRYFISLGLGNNQIKLLKKINKKYKIIGIDRKLSSEAKKIISIYYKSSIYDINKIRLISKNIKNKKIAIEAIIYRSSGPTIISAYYLEKKFHIKRISYYLQKSIYSKSFFSNFLKKNRIITLKSKNLITSIKPQYNISIIKPDAPIVGKKNIYKVSKDQNFKTKFQLCKKESHNKKVNISNYYDGVDISSFYLVDNKRNIINLIAHTQEYNYFINNKLKNIGISSPPIYDKKNIIFKKLMIDKQIIKKFDGYYGLISITSKITRINDQILPYEVNIGLSGDRFADQIFPHLFKTKSLYEIEINLSLLKSKIKFVNKHINFIGFLNKKKILSKSYFFNQINKLYKNI